jgi:VWFA-related protein
MRTRLLLVLFLAAVTSSCCALRQITVEQLGSILSSANGKPDAQIALQLSEIELSERLSTANLSRLQAQAAGSKSRQALLVLADLSAFLALPPAEVPAKPAPDVATQRQILTRTVDYVLKIIHQLPNLSTMRVTSGFQSTPFPPQQGQSDTPSHQPLHPLGTYSASIVYRDGGEVVQASTAQSAPAAQGLTTSGEFGPILNTALLDAARSKLAWSHWEQGTQGVQAVFHYTVPAEKSHYEVKYCCVWRQNGDRVYFQQFAGYQGDIAVDPADGTILRLTLMADLKPTDPLVKAGILVEYGPVVIAGKTYTCPSRSVALSIGLEIRDIQQASISSLGLLQTSLNDSVFEHYHVFRSAVRVLAGNGEAKDEEMDKAPHTESLSDPATAATSLPASEKPSLAALPEKGVVSAPPALSPPAAPAAPEISVGDAAAALPETASIPVSVVSPQTAVRANTPLVDVDVIASDKNGRPVTGLVKEDFEIYDNGRRQITQVLNDGAKRPTEEAVAPSGRRSFFNSRSSARGSSAEAVDDHFTVLMIDPANLAWADLNHARAEILRALLMLPADERVALYITRGPALKVLVEGTMDRALLASRLREWLPSARDLALAQQEEEHDRQSLNKAGNISDQEHVNGTSSSDLASVASVNAKLGDTPEAESPEAQALAALIRVARSLVATPGHKNLVWISSEHALAGGPTKTAGSDRNSKQADTLLLRTEQALNYANLSLYPLDASRLAAPAIEAGMQNDSPAAGRSSRDAPSAQRDPEMAARIGAASQPDIQPADRALQQLAEATGGHGLGPVANLVPELQTIIADGRAMYQLSFAPDDPPDDQYHRLLVKLSSHRGVTLRYRAGYEYAARPSTLKERFQEAVWQPADIDEIALSATPVSSVKESKLMLNIATADLALKLEGQRWRDKLDIFLVEHDEQGVHATITGQTLSLALKPDTFHDLTPKGIPFEQVVGSLPAAGSVRIVVVDENSGLMGSVTVPANALPANP